MVYRESLKLQSRDRAVSFHDVTAQVKEIAAKSGMKNGICVVYSHHTTCSGCPLRQFISSSAQLRPLSSEIPFMLARPKDVFF